MKDMVLKARENVEIRLKLINDFEPLIKKCIKIYVKNMEYFMDAMQEGKLTVLFCVKHYDVNSSFPFQAYVKRAVIYSIRDFSKRIRQEISLDAENDEEGGSLLDVLKSEVDIEGDKVRETDFILLHRAILNLTDKQREIIEDVFFKNINMREAAKNRRCHYMTVVTLKDRALKRLKELMDEGF